tara:strand:- start:416 stop:682 length:267 start_codon:yes stop_codon:yes gene_type:complete
MARATIPYADIDAKVAALFPWPTYQSVVLDVPRSFNDTKAPTTVYDRRTGNYARIGYRVWVSRERISGFDNQFRAKYTRESGYVIVEV